MLASLYTAALGCAAGSFANVLIYRLPRGFKVNLPRRSLCTNCFRRLDWYENIPVLSYLALRGRCRSCKTQIGGRHLVVELLTGLLFLTVYRFIEPVWGLSLAWVYYSVFALALIATTFIDIDFRIIPDELSIGVGIFALAFSWIPGGPGFLEALKGAAVGAGIFWFIGWVYERITGREGMGFGDVKLLGMIGAFLGPIGVVQTILFSSVAGTVVGLVLMLVQRQNMKMAIPYGPFLALGGLASFFWGSQLLGGLYGGGY